MFNEPSQKLIKSLQSKAGYKTHQMVIPCDVSTF